MALLRTPTVAALNALIAAKTQIIKITRGYNWNIKIATGKGNQTITNQTWQFGR